MMNIKKVISIIMVFCVVFSSISIAVFSLSWDGSSAGGSTNAVNGSATGYVIMSNYTLMLIKEFIQTTEV